MSVIQIRQLLVVSLLLAAGALILLSVLDNNTEQKPAAALPQLSPKFQIVNAIKPIARGSMIHADDIALEETLVPPNPGTVTNVTDAVERAVVRNIAPGDSISDANTAALSKGVRLSELVPPGLRAVAIRVTDETSVANLVQPSDRVDVLLVSNAMHSAQTGAQFFPPVEAVTLLQNVPVLAVGDMTVAGGSGKPANRNVTLAVTPEQAAALAMLNTIGTGYLTLRSRSDDSEASVETVSTQDIRPRKASVSSPPSKSVPNIRLQSIEVIAGASANTTHIAIGGSN